MNLLMFDHFKEEKFKYRERYGPWNGRNMESYNKIKKKNNKIGKKVASQNIQHAGLWTNRTYFSVKLCVDAKQFFRMRIVRC